MPTWALIVIGILGTSSVAALVPKIWDAIASLHRKKRHKLTKQEALLESINNKLDSLANRVDTLESKSIEQERNEIRMQLMLLFSSYSGKSDEIFTVAKKYFVALCGNSYIKTLFKDWCKANDEQLPDWYLERFGND